ncbi:hypothetical protein [Beijerinckia sp. L45]|uniref:hypothetical protein n=1 Tax=Beijerinckia sp. L45 TaxID=1641855 RepID=UPI00131E847E|nr:hypothetical protein [Beijerinckia sp. L45]
MSCCLKTIKKDRQNAGPFSFVEEIRRRTAIMVFRAHGADRNETQISLQLAEPRGEQGLDEIRSAFEARNHCPDRVGIEPFGSVLDREDAEGFLSDAASKAVTRPSLVDTRPFATPQRLDSSDNAIARRFECGLGRFVVCTHEKLLRWTTWTPVPVGDIKISPRQGASICSRNRKAKLFFRAFVAAIFEHNALKSREPHLAGPKPCLKIFLRGNRSRRCHATFSPNRYKRKFALAPIHPTTHAIASGLLGIELPSGDRLAFIADHARRIADRHDLPARDALFQAVTDGWDLGIRSTGTFGAEIAATRLREGTGLRLIITVLFDRRVCAGWTFLWMVQNEGSSLRATGALYPNDTAPSFATARFAAERAAEERALKWFGNSAATGFGPW